MAAFHWLDYVLFVVFMAASLVIGVYYACSGGKQQTVQEFLLGNRKLKMLPTMLSLAMSYQSAILILGRPAEIYSYGVRIVLWHAVGFFVAAIIVERLIVPWVFPQKFVSIFQVSKAVIVFVYVITVKQMNVLLGAFGDNIQRNHHLVTSCTLMHIPGLRNFKIFICISCSLYRKNLLRMKSPTCNFYHAKFEIPCSLYILLPILNSNKANGF